EVTRGEPAAAEGRLAQSTHTRVRIVKQRQQIVGVDGFFVGSDHGQGGATNLDVGVAQQLRDVPVQVDAWLRRQLDGAQARLDFGSAQAGPGQFATGTERLDLLALPDDLQC